MDYKVQEHLKPTRLQGISEAQIDDHWNLYAAYVAQTNALKKELEELRAEGKGGTPNYADRRRRFGFEFNGMVLHEYYFANLKHNVPETTAADFIAAVEKSFGSFDAWKEDFMATGKSRGIGWAICAMDPVTGDLNNHFVQLHEDGNVAGFSPVLVMDCWEHAYMVDHKAGGRPDYINAFFGNVAWDVVNRRFRDAQSKHASIRNI